MVLLQYCDISRNSADNNVFSGSETSNTPLQTVSADNRWSAFCSQPNNASILSQNWALNSFV